MKTLFLIAVLLPASVSLAMHAMPWKFIGISEYAMAREVVIGGASVTVKPDPAPVVPNPKPDVTPEPNPNVCPNCNNKGYTVTPGDEMRVDCNNPDCPVRRKANADTDCPYCHGTGKYIREGKEYSCLNPNCEVFKGSGIELLKVYNKNWYYVYKDGVKYVRKRPKGYERVTGKWIGKDVFQVCRGNSCRRYKIEGGMAELRLHPEQYGPDAVK